MNSSQNVPKFTSPNIRFLGSVNKRPEDISGGGFAAGEWADVSMWVHKSLVVGGDPFSFELPGESKINSFRTYLSGYGREHLRCYENGWRFLMRVVKPETEDGGWVIYIWKVASNIHEKGSLSHPHKNKK